MKIVSFQGVVKMKYVSIRHSQQWLTSGHRWLIPVILATWEAEIRSIAVWGQPGQIVLKSLSQKISNTKRALEFLSGTKLNFSANFRCSREVISFFWYLHMSNSKNWDIYIIFSK
jgi:hypothetical protein